MNVLREKHQIVTSAYGLDIDIAYGSNMKSEVVIRVGESKIEITPADAVNLAKDILRLIDS